MKDKKRRQPTTVMFVPRTKGGGTGKETKRERKRTVITYTTLPVPAWG